MKFVLFSPSHLTPDEMRHQSTQTEDGLTNNALVFTAPPKTSLQLKTQRLIVEAKQQAQKDAALLFAQTSKELATETETLGNLLLQDGTYVDTIALATPATGADIANKGGYAARHPAVHGINPPAAPQGFSVSTGDNTGEADVHWDKVAGSDLYKVSYSLNTVTPVWVLGDSVKITKATLTSLPTGVPILFMVTAHNTNGDSAPSATVQKNLL